MKKFEDMTLAEQVDYVTGRLTLAIGQGKFRDEVTLWLMKMHKLGYDAAAKRDHKEVPE